MRTNTRENTLTLKWRPVKGDKYIWSGHARRVSFRGWDGKSYNGETEVLPTYYEKIGCHTSNTEYVLKYTRKWGWTIHRLLWDREENMWVTDFVEGGLEVGAPSRSELYEMVREKGNHWSVFGNGMVR